MGWLFTHGQTKADLITHLTEGDSKLRTIRKCLRGNTLWAIQEDVEQPGRFIVAYLMQSDPGFGWGYKPVTESMGPAQLSCPISYLDAVPEPDNSSYAKAWRDRVRQRNADKRRLGRAIANAATGDQITLAAGLEPRTLFLVSKKPLVGEAHDGSRWRVPRRFVASIDPVSADTPMQSA